VAAITDGLAEALSHAGVDYAAELATLVRATDLGLNALAVVTTAAQARQATAAGLRQLLVYPAAIHDDPSHRSRCVAIALETVQAAREAAPDTTILAFRHPGYGAILEPLIAATDGVVDWAIVRREMKEATG
jgi:predicted TIM-barrel enzyme